jgi:hypothetical protein
VSLWPAGAGFLEHLSICPYEGSTQVGFCLSICPCEETTQVGFCLPGLSTCCPWLLPPRRACSVRPICPSHLSVPSIRPLTPASVKKLS